MENINLVTGFWQFLALIVISIIVPYFTKWLQTKEFKKAGLINENFHEEYKKQYKQINEKIDNLILRIQRSELDSKKNNLRCLILHFGDLTTISEQIKRKDKIEKMYVDYLNNGGGDELISSIYDDFIKRYDGGYYKKKKPRKNIEKINL